MMKHTPEIGKWEPDRRRKPFCGKMAAAAAAGILALSVAGCSAGSGQASGTAAVTDMETASQTSASDGSTSGKQEETSQQSQGNPGGKAAEYSASDLNAAWDQSDSTRITCTGSQAQIEGQGASVKEGVITISAAGTYVLSGRFEGQVLVEAGSEDEVRLVLNGFQITNEQTSPIYGVQSGSIMLILADGTENTVSDGAAYVFESPEEDEPDAAVFSKDNLIISGQGTLRVTGNYSNGIRSKDGIKVVSGTIDISAVKDGLKGKDFVLIRDGQIMIESGEDGIKSNNDKDAEKGYVVIDGGDIQINAGDDGIHAETWLTVNSGTIDIQKSYEGLEGMKVDINGGDIRIVSSDDGINAAGGDSGSESSGERAKMQNNPELYVRITGGTVRIDASADGIDSNGNLYVEGGEIYISGPEQSGDGALDYNGEALISGGTIAAAGSAGMVQTFSQESTQNMLMVYYDQVQTAGTSLTLKDSSGQNLLEYRPEKAYQCVLISLPGLEEGKTYQLENGSANQEITVSGVITTVGEAPAGRMGGGRPGQGGRGGRPDMGTQPGEQAEENGVQPGEQAGENGAPPQGGDGASPLGRTGGGENGADGGENADGGVNGVPPQGRPGRGASGSGESIDGGNSSAPQNRPSGGNGPRRGNSQAAGGEN